MDPIILSAIIGGALILMTGGKKKKRGAPALPEIGDEPPADTDNLPDPTGQDANMLGELGYGNTAAGIEAFQYEWNLVERAFSLWKLLVKDGKMGENTRGALIRALAYVENQGRPWAEIVAEALAAQPKFQMSANDKGNFQSLGYTIGPKVVEDFQKDFNAAAPWWNDSQYGPSNPDLLGYSTLVEDNNLGPLARDAVTRAQDAQNSVGVKWKTLVTQAKQA